MTRNAGRVIGPIVAAVVGLAIVAGVAWFVFLRPDLKRYRAPSENMLPTIEIGERFVANRDAYDEGEVPERGEIVVLHPPEGATGETAQKCGKQVTETQLCPEPGGEPSDISFIKRVVAVEGDRVGMRDGKVVLNGRPLDEPYTRPCEDVSGCDFTGEITIPDGHVFVMGDNRGFSDDSRFWGPIPVQSIIGRVEDCSWLGIGCEPVR